MKVSESYQKAYNSQYDDSIREWRKLGAKYKAENIIRLAKTITFKNVIEVGCGTGDILHYLSEQGFSSELYGVEISESGIKQVKEKNIKHLKDVLLFDGYKIPFPDNYFDLAVCSHVLEHVEHERLFLREVLRVSKNQIFEVPIDFSFFVDNKINHYLSYGHINIYTPSLLKFLLKTEGVKVKDEIFFLYPTPILKEIYKQKIKYFTAKAKNLILKTIPSLRKIKPQSYAVLTSKSEQKTTIFTPNIHL